MTDLLALLPVLVALIGVLGLLIGSFLNVVIHRVPRGESVVSPPSSCPGCGERIAAYDNVPVLSWLVLRAKCRRCGERISARYPLVEAATGVAFAGVALVFLPPVLEASTTPDALAAIAQLLAFLVLAGSAVALAAIDLDTHRLPNPIVYSTGIAGLVLLALAVLGDAQAGDLGRALAGAGILFAFYLALALARPGGMGLGDVKLAAVLGLYLGWVGWGALAVGAFAAFLIGGIVGLLLIAVRRARRGTGIPFGPWMLAGAWIGIVAGEPLFTGYLGAVGLV